MTKIKVGWYCSCFVGVPYWHGTEIYEPDECDTEFETVEDLDEFERQECNAKCPMCGSELWQEWDEPWVIEIVPP